MKKLYYVLMVSFALVLMPSFGGAQPSGHHDNGLHLGWLKGHHDHNGGEDEDDDDNDNGGKGGKDTSGTNDTTIIIIIHHHGGGGGNGQDTSIKTDTIRITDTVEVKDTVHEHDTVRIGGTGATGNAHTNPFGLSDTCLAVFISMLPNDTAAIVKADFAAIDSNRIALDTLIVHWKLVKKSGDTTGKADSIKALIKANEQSSLAIWQQLIQIGVAELNILTDVRTTCGGDSSTIGPKGGGSNSAAIDVTPVSPNPVMDKAQVSLSVRSTAEAPVSIQVFDEMGVQVKDILEGTVAANSPKSVTFDTSSLKPGVYILRVQSGAYVNSQKLVIN